MFNVDEYLNVGYSICDFNCDTINEIVCKASGTNDLNLIHNTINDEGINKLRLAIIEAISVPFVKNNIYSQLKEVLTSLIGTEVAVQKNVNLNLHLPGDSDFLLPMHSDVLCGNSPYEVVVWIPLVDVKKTQSLCLYDYRDSMEIIAKIKENKTISEIEKEYCQKRKFIDLKKGQVLIFFPGLIHGNVVNEEEFSRVSLNIRFKNYHSPYHDKKLNAYFEYLSLGAQTKLAMKYIEDIRE